MRLRPDLVSIRVAAAASALSTRPSRLGVEPLELCLGPQQLRVETTCISKMPTGPESRLAAFPSAMLQQYVYTQKTAKFSGAPPLAPRQCPSDWGPRGPQAPWPGGRGPLGFTPRFDAGAPEGLRLVYTHTRPVRVGFMSRSATLGASHT